MKFQMFCTLAAIGLAASPLSAANITANATDIAAAMKEAGYRADISEDGAGDPLISTGVGGDPFLIVFYGCDGTQDCKTVQLYAYFETEEPVSLESINAWNAENRFGKAVLDEDGDVALRLDIDLEDGGISKELFLDNLEYWEVVLNQLTQHIY